MQKNKTILITGIGGYIGSNLAYYLVNSSRGYIVKGIGRKTKFDLLRRRLPMVELITADVSDEEKVKKSITDVDVVIHTAAPLSEDFCSKHNKEARKAIVDGTRYIAKETKKQGALLIHISTQAVYGTYKKRTLPISEEDDLLPDTEYGKLKAEAEEMALGANAIILRLSYVFGKGSVVPMHKDFVIGKFIEMALRGKNLTIKGNGNVLLDFVHIRDLNETVGHLIEHVFKSLPTIINIGSGDPVSLNSTTKTIQGLIKEKNGTNIKILRENIDGNKKPISRFLTTDKIKNIMPHFRKINFRDGLKELIENTHE